MSVKRILLIVFLLGIWGSAAASVYPEAPVALAPAQHALHVAPPAVCEELVAIGSEHRCECPAVAQNAQMAVSESSKFLVVSYTEGAGTFLNLANPGSVALAAQSRASSFIAHRSGQPPYLLVSRLRQ